MGRQLIDQVSDAPSIICFFVIFYGLRTVKTLFFICNVIRKENNKLKGFLQRFLQDIMKKKPHNIWNIRRLVDEWLGPST
jgi:hypothetical protein